MKIQLLSNEFLLVRYFRSNLRRYFAFGSQQHVGLLWQQSSVLRILISSVVIDTECIEIATGFWKQVSPFHSFSWAKHSLSCLCCDCLPARLLYVTLKTQSRYILENTRNPMESMYKEGFAPYSRQWEERQKLCNSIWFPLYILLWNHPKVSQKIYMIVVMSMRLWYK